AATYTSTLPPPPTCTAGQFLATYYAGVALGGSPIQTVCEAVVDHDWGWGSESGAVGGDNFSARWVARPSFAGGTHRFTVTADDGVRLWVDGALLIDRWIDQGATTYTADVALTAGEHVVKMEYFERCCSAVARLAWAPVHPTLPVAPAPPMTSGTTPSLTDVVQGVYRLVLERVGEPAGVDLFLHYLNSGWTVRQVVRFFVTSPEYKQTFVDGRPPREVAALLYRHLHAREPWPAELDRWEPVVAGGG
ncbi:MAG TPA: PA14 domain-containing protein, partial [Longimicrobium sp.]|nr:PA14 domain-containing protein [Longimicrobium sp.]